MHWVAVAGLVSAVLGGLFPSFHSNPLQATFPQEARGDLPFQVDAARFLEEGRPVVDIWVALPQGTLQEPDDSVRVLAAVELLNHRGKPQAEFRTELALPPVPAATAGDFPVPQRWLRLSPKWLEGTAGLRVRVEDLSRLKVGLYDQIKGKHRAGVAEGRLLPKADQPEPFPWMSDLLFVWAPAVQVPAEPAATGLRSVRSRLDPNPFRYYGRYQPILTVYWERYPAPEGAGLAPGARLLEQQRILRLPDSLVVHEAAETLSASAEPRWSLKRVDLSDLEGGSYLYEVALVDAQRARFLSTARGAFEVVWERENWVLGDRDLLAYGRVLLPAEEFERFEALDRGGMETYLRDLWNRHAPARPDQENELERKFADRVAFASQTFGGAGRGILSDRGRVYIRYGPPDEVRANLNPQDEELLWITLPQEIADDGVDDANSRRRLSRRRTPQDNSAYEIWEYTVRGDPLLPEYVMPGQRLGLKFIFVDELGGGDYSLVYSSAPGALH